MMKTKKFAVGILVIGCILISVSVLIASNPSGSAEQSQQCHFNPRQCIVPSNLGDFNMFPK